MVIWNRLDILATRTRRWEGSSSDSGSGSCGAPSEDTPVGEGTRGGFEEVPQHAEAKQATLNILKASLTRAIIADRRRVASNHGRQTRRIFR